MSSASANQHLLILLFMHVLSITINTKMIYKIMEQTRKAMEQFQTKALEVASPKN